MDEPTGLSKEQLKKAIIHESKNFEEYYLWLEKHMPKAFFDEINSENLMILTHNLMSLHLQDHFSQIHLKDSAIVLCPNSVEADLRILKNYDMHGIRYYRTFLSNAPLPHDPEKRTLRIAFILFTEAVESPGEVLAEDRKEELLALVKARNPKVTEDEFLPLLKGFTARFLRSMTTERITLALDMFFRARIRDHCQYQVRYHEDWKEKQSPSMQIVLAWRNVPKYKFLHRLAQTIYRHNLNMQRVVATYIDPYSTENVLILSLGLHGINGKAAWDEANVPDFLRELVTLKYFDTNDLIESSFVHTNLLSGNMANLLRTMVGFVHQILVHADPNLYSLANIEEGLCRHQELTVRLCEAFELKFHPENQDIERYQKVRNGFLLLVENLDTGHAVNDTRRKNILRQTLNFIDHTLKTNFFRRNKTSYSFRVDPAYLDYVPFDRREKFPMIPFGIFYIKNSFFTGFHIRFKDLSRGGLRTVMPEKIEQLIVERNNVFSECYNLAFTQHKKNKDIPEGGSKAVILLEPFDRMLHEAVIYKREMETAGIDPVEIEEKLKTFKKAHKLEYLYSAQRSFINSFLSIINCEDDGTLITKNVVDYWKRPEYIYLGPDENMHNNVIEWIATHSEKHGYKPGKSFISSKPSLGINHKEYGVTSLGVFVYLTQALLNLGIDPEKDPFTIKISGGPDGDVAGNLVLSLQKHCKKTAKLIALTDISGTIYDPEGLDLDEMANLFHTALPIRYYPPDKLSEGAFLLDLRTKREQTAYIQQTLCWRKKDGELIQDWLSGNEMNHLFRHNVHEVKSDVFVPAGGRPRTLNENNYKDFLDETGKPTSKAIVEGANLYITQEGRRALEKLGVLIFRDSSANKGGVICSSYEVLCTLTLTEEEFKEEKDVLISQILELIKKAALNEALLMLHTHQKDQSFLTDLSEEVSQRINTFKYELLDYLETVSLSNNPQDPLIRSLFLYCPPLIQEKYAENLLQKVPDVHKKAIIACYIASHIVYNRGLNWSPSIVDVLPVIAQDPNLTGDFIQKFKKDPEKESS